MLDREEGLTAPHVSLPAAAHVNVYVSVPVPEFWTVKASDGFAPEFALTEIACATGVTATAYVGATAVTFIDPVSVTLRCSPPRAATLSTPAPTAPREYVAAIVAVELPRNATMPVTLSEQVVTEPLKGHVKL